MNINSGFKIVDKLAQTHGVSCFHTDNPFQLTVDIPKDTTLYELRHVIKPFGLKDFPHTMWLALQQKVPTQMEMSLHRFTLPHANQVLCWVLVDSHGRVIERAFPLNKPKYTNAAKVLIQSILGRLNYA